jgi:hypothetical protein
VDRLFTAFVSSTYKDLARERSLVANALLNETTVPLGMEFFPSTGADQWSAILDAMKAADFTVVIIAGMYGSIDPESGLSWTHREYRECVAQGKPRIALLHRDLAALPPDRREATVDRADALTGFRREIEQNSVCRYFRDDAELMTGLLGSVSALRHGGRIEGWIPAGKRPVEVQETDFDRNYELLQSDFYFARGAEGSVAWDLHLVTRRRMRCNCDEGIRRIPIDFVRDSDPMLPFEAEKPPRMEIVSSSRTGVGSCRLLRPRKAIGTSFVQDVEFNPPIAKDEVVDFTVDCLVPSYKYAYSDDILLATRSSPMGPRNYEYVTRTIGVPTDLLLMSVFLPDSLAASPAGPKVGRANRVDDAESAGVVLRREYSERADLVNGLPGVLMSMAVPKPRLNRKYRLAWNLPARREPDALRPMRV